MPTGSPFLVVRRSARAPRGHRCGESFLRRWVKRENLRAAPRLPAVAGVVELGLDEELEAGRGDLGDSFDGIDPVVASLFRCRGWCIPVVPDAVHGDCQEGRHWHHCTQRHGRDNLHKADHPGPPLGVGDICTLVRRVISL